MKKKLVAIWFFLVITFFGNIAYSTGSSTIYDAHDSSIRYVGRVDKSAKDKVIFAYPAVTIEAYFTGNKIGVILEDLKRGGDCNFLTIIIDDQEPEVQRLESSKTTYFFTAKAKKPEHTIKIVKRTESMVGKVAFYGFELPKKQKLLIQKPSDKKIIEFIGNSITCGYGNELKIDAPPSGDPTTGFNSKNEDAYMSYASITARKLNADAILTSYSGIGIFRNFNGDTSETMPQRYDRIFADEPDGPKVDFSKNKPDLVVINLGHNDYYLESEDKPINDDVYVKHYIAFVDRLMRYYPDAKFVFTIGSMTTDIWPMGKNCLSRLRTNLKKVEKHYISEEKKSVFVALLSPQTPPYGEDWHPAQHTHLKMAEELSDFISKNIW